MAGPVQQTAQDVGVPSESIARSWSDAILEWLGRLADTQFSGDVVILIVILALSPWLIGIVRAWIGRRRK